MKRNVAGWVVVVFMVCGGVSAVRAAEQGGQSPKQQETSTGATPSSQPGTLQAAPAVQPMSAAPAATTQTIAPSPLEGTTWPVKVTPDAIAAQTGEKPFDDSLIFKDGTVTMSACVKMGFAPSGYTTLPTGSTWSFMTRQVSTSQGTTKWMATFAEEAVKGTMVWMKQDGTVLHYTFEGKKATNPKVS